MKIWKIILNTFGLIPYLWIISLLTFYFHAAKLLGYFPEFSRPDPKELNIYNDYSPIIDLLGQTWILSLLLWFILIIVYLVVNRKQINWRPLIFGTCGQILAIIIMFSGINEWYFD